MNLKSIKTKFKRYFQKRKIGGKGIKFLGELPKFSIGEETFCNGLKIYCWDNETHVKIGKYCSIADNTQIIAGGEHHKQWVSTFPFIDKWGLDDLQNKNITLSYRNRDVIIGNDVWIAQSSTILSGVTIGNGAVIGAGSVVTRDIPPYSIAVGSPAKVIKYRFTDKIIKELLELKWWDWDKEDIKKSLFYIDDVEGFVNFSKGKTKDKLVV